MLTAEHAESAEMIKHITNSALSACSAVKGIFLLLLGFVALIWSPSTYAKVMGASLNEELSITEQLFVFGSAQALAEAGVGDRGFLSIQEAASAALAIAQEGEPVLIKIGEGIYRERVELIQDPSIENAPIVFNVTDEDYAKVALAGSDVLNGWQIGESDLFERVWPFADSVSERADLPQALRQSDLMFVKGVRLRQVSQREQVRQGCFFIDRASSMAYALPPKNGSIAHNLVEVGNPERSTLLYCRGVKNLIFKGLIFMHAPAASSGEEGAVHFEECTNIFFEKCLAEYNNRMGFSFEGCFNVTLKRVQANRNALTGLSFQHSGNILLKACEVDLNGWRFLETGFDSFERYGAIQLQAVDGIASQSLRSTENRTNGLYGSGLVGIVLFNKLYSAANSGAGALFMDTDYLDVKYGQLIKNKGVGIQASGDLKLEGSVIFDNEDFQIRVEAFNGKKNIIGSTVASAGIIALDQLPEDGSIFGNLNLYYAPESKAFKVGNQRLAFDAWQLLMDTDLGSRWEDPKFADASNYEYMPTSDSPWFSMGQWDFREVTVEQVESAREAFLQE